MANGVGGRAVLEGKRQQDRGVLQQSVDCGAGLVGVNKQFGELAVVVSADADGKPESTVLDLGDVVLAAIGEALARRMAVTSDTKTSAAGRSGCASPC